MSGFDSELDGTKKGNLDGIYQTLPTSVRMRTQLLVDQKGSLRRFDRPGRDHLMQHWCVAALSKESPTHRVLTLTGMALKIEDLIALQSCLASTN
jgi:hypothetical protein